MDYLKIYCSKCGQDDSITVNGDHDYRQWFTPVFEGVVLIECNRCQSFHWEKVEKKRRRFVISETEAILLRDRACCITTNTGKEALAVPPDVRSLKVPSVRLFVEGDEISQEVLISVAISFNPKDRFVEVTLFDPLEDFNYLQQRVLADYSMGGEEPPMFIIMSTAENGMNFKTNYLTEFYLFKLPTIRREPPYLKIISDDVFLSIDRNPSWESRIKPYFFSGEGSEAHENT